MNGPFFFGAVVGFQVLALCALLVDFQLCGIVLLRVLWYY